MKKKRRTLNNEKTTYSWKHVTNIRHTSLIYSAQSFDRKSPTFLWPMHNTPHKSNKYGLRDIGHGLLIDQVTSELHKRTFINRI